MEPPSSPPAARSRALVPALAAVAVALTPLAAGPTWAFYRPAAVFRRHAVAADHTAASRAGEAVLRAGGNAVDAAVATALALGVVSPAASGFGGGGFAVICRPTGACVFVDFRETAPPGLTAEALARSPEGARASHVGGLAVAVPGEPAGLAYLARRYGRVPLARSVAPAVALARGGFAVTPYVAERARAGAADLARDPTLAGLWLPGGSPVAAGARVTRPLLAATLARYGREGDGYVRGAFAQAYAAAAQARGGVLTADDIAAYQPVERPVLTRSFGGRTIATASYPSAGGLVMLQALAMLEGAAPERLRPGSSAYYHLLAEAWRQGFDDRARYVGDPANEGVVPPDALLEPARMARRRARIDPQRTSAVAPDEPPRDHGTTHLCAVDADGLMVSLTTTVNESFGARVAAPTLDVILNDEIDDFSLGAGSSYGLAASRPNALAAGRRPVSSMTPTIVLEGGRPVACVGAAGGPRITTATTQVLLNLVLHGLDPEAALAAPRVHHQGAPAELRVEREVPEDVREALRARGHTVVEDPSLAAAQALVVRGEGAERRVLAASDPRRDAHPAGQ
jgi:gamma-glutamyltranspeptidase/glutathione hydrolase